MTTPDALVVEAARHIGISTDEVRRIRLGDTAIFRLSRGVVARVSRPDRRDAARKEVAVSRWLTSIGIPVVRALDVAQPVQVHGCPVTFWAELPAHHKGTPAALADALRRLHGVAIPAGLLQPPEPFARLGIRLDAAITLSDEDRAWLSRRVARLREDSRTLPAGLPPTAIHGDAHTGNLVVAQDGTAILLDLDCFAVGRPEWDLALMAVARQSAGWLSTQDYTRFCERYGHDVTAWAGYPLLRDIYELRMTLYVAQLAAERADARAEAAYRVACLRGERGPRPWRWTPM